MKVRLTVYTLRKSENICRNGYQVGGKYVYPFEDLFTSTKLCGSNKRSNTKYLLNIQYSCRNQTGMTEVFLFRI